MTSQSFNLFVHTFRQCPANQIHIEIRKCAAVKDTMTAVVQYQGIVCVPKRSMAN